jgi:hypothetical protein
LVTVEVVKMERCKDLADLKVFSDRQKVARWLVVRRKELAKNPCTCALGFKRDTSTHWSLKTDTRTSSTRFSRL